SPFSDDLVLGAEIGAPEDLGIGIVDLCKSLFASLARSAEVHGNGILEITARGNLQIRGLRAETVGQLAADIDAAGITVPDGPVIETSPLH
ncbi:hypothetical protein ACCT04_35015, partial [Rhizobium ruizarguesonis]